MASWDDGTGQDDYSYVFIGTIRGVIRTYVINRSNIHVGKYKNKYKYVVI